MIPINELLFFALAAFLLVISPGPNMIYVISRTLSQGKISGLISLAGVICGFFFHIVLVSFGLTAILFAVPYAYLVLKFAGTAYLLFLAYQAFRPKGKDVFKVNAHAPHDSRKKLFMVGFLTNVLNPKVAFFYLSLFPQFIKPEYGSVWVQSLELGALQVLISSSVNFMIVISAAGIATFFNKNPLWLKAQKWLMGSVLTCLAIKMAFSHPK
ncbi:lysine transporter LysE [Chryseobacterium soli]|uniref:Lysine transporter LysE n=1 Tax=Chryseobacterium soli TaxID=445961 RepID=A0A086A614_9FLAO|nr:LysE family translocator [Chryseobacterium soli]KFF12128.1 lysine transporter LysE [Chryseobacterium soli]